MASRKSLNSESTGEGISTSLSNALASRLAVISIFGRGFFRSSRSSRIWLMSECSQDAESEMVVPVLRIPNRGSLLSLGVMARLSKPRGKKRLENTIERRAPADIILT